MLTLSRSASVAAEHLRLIEQECSSVRWTHHRLLDFEFAHQAVIDAAAEAIIPGVTRVGSLVSRLMRRAKRAARTTEGAWCPPPKPALLSRLRARLAEMRLVRNADPRWKAALGWAEEPVGEAKACRRRRAKPADKIKRRKNETGEAFAERFALLTTDETDEHFAQKLAQARRETRRDVFRKSLYRERRIYWGTWNALLRSVDQARADVLKRRREGLPADLRRPKFRDPVSLAADDGGFRIVERNVPGKRGGAIWWVVEMRVGTGDEWVRVRAKCGTWHAIPEGAKIATAKLTRRMDGQRWVCSLSLTVETNKPGDERRATSGVVAFDWGHREHGHPREDEGLRAWTWRGDDGRTGEILIPAQCRNMLDEIDELKSRVDKAFDARKAARGLPDRNRHGYRIRLMRSGVQTAEEALWLQWEMKYERRIQARRDRIANIRKEVYTQAVRELRQSYARFAFEDERVHDPSRNRKSIREVQTDEQMPRRKRANRDLATRYEFVSLCERFGADIIPVTARNTTRECPTCGQLGENGPELLTACPGCGTVRDKDEGATVVILRRAQEALASHAAE